MGSIAGTDLEVIFGTLQGENWSPLGEANTFIRAKGAQHTSMSVGDVIKLRGEFYVVAGMGFTKL